MKNMEIHFTKGNILVFALAILIYISSFNNVGSNPNIKLFGFVSLLIMLISCIGVFFINTMFSKSIYKMHFMIGIYSLPFIAVYFIGVFLNTSGIVTFLQFILLLGLMFMFSIIKWRNIDFIILGSITSVFVGFQVIVWISQGMPNFFSSIYQLSNLVGAYMLYSIIVLFLVRQHIKKVYLIDTIIIFSFIILMFSNTRSALLALFVFLLAFIFWKSIIKNKLRYFTLFTVYIIALVSICFIYLRLPEWKYFANVENWMIENTGKSLMSGREDIWSVMIYLIGQKPLLGYGTGMQNSDISELEKTGHNLYLQILMQNGYLGLIAFFILILFIWSIYWKQRNAINVRVAGAALIATLFYQSFEITFTQNALSIGALQWALIGIGLSSAIYCKAEENINFKNIRQNNIGEKS